MINSGTNGSRINCENATVVCRSELCWFRCGILFFRDDFLH